MGKRDFRHRILRSAQMGLETDLVGHLWISRFIRHQLHKELAQQFVHWVVVASPRH